MDYFPVELSFNKVLKVLKNLEDLRFLFKEIDPGVSTIIINKGDIISMISNRDRSRTPHIRMYQIKRSTTFIIRASIRKLMTLCFLARVAHWLTITIKGTRKKIISNDSLDNGKGCMTQTTMPSPCRRPTNKTLLLLTMCSCLLRPQGVEAVFTPASMKDFLRGQILYKEMIRMKLDTGIIIWGEAMNRDKVFICTRNMKNVL